jgi:hypothetical protein
MDIAVIISTVSKKCRIAAYYEMTTEVDFREATYDLVTHAVGQTLHPTLPHAERE